MSALPPLTVAVPLLVAAALATVSRIIPRLIADGVALVTAFTVGVLCALLLYRSADGTVVYWFGGWQPRHGVALGISLAIDPFGAGLGAFAGLLTVAALIFSWCHFETVNPAFHVLMLVFLAAMVGFGLSGDLFNMFVFFELMTVSAIALIANRIDERPPLEGSLNFAITNTLGGFLVLSGIGLIYGRTGALNLAQIGESLKGRPPDGLVLVSFALLLTGFFIKAAVVPFHFWLADAYAVAPTPVCVLLSGAMSELGLYAVARIYWTAFAGTLGPSEPNLRIILVIAGIFTALLGAIMCFLQSHLKRMLAFATVSYIGLFLVGIGLLTPEGLAGAAIYVLGDGFVKASLFVSVGIIQHRRAHLEEPRLWRRCRDLRFTAAVFILGALGLAAMPPFGAFLGKSVIEEAALKEGYDWLPALFTLASIFTGGAVLRAAGQIFFGWGRPAESPGESARTEEEAEPETEQTRDRTPATLFGPALGLLVAGLAVGVVPGVAHVVEEAAARFVDTRAYAAVILHGHKLAAPTVKPSPVPTATDLFYAILSTAGALALAALALLGPRLPRKPPRILAAALRTAALRLHALHSGHPGDYVAWIVLGAAVFGGLFALLLH